MMAVEGPFLAAIIARLPDPKFSLAAFGVSVAFAILVEAPVIMIMSASTALVRDRQSFQALRNFTQAMNGVVTAAMLVVLIPSVFRVLMQDVIGLTDDVARLTYWSLVLLLPWPGAIGYRRFYQGILIRWGKTRLVAFGTILRLVAMSGTAIVLYAVSTVPGAYVGAAALSAGVTVEAIAGRIMAHPTLTALRSAPGEESHPLRYFDIARFYYPLAATSIVGLTVHPLLTFFMGRARFPIESLAVFPVVHSLSFIFRAMGLSYQEVAIALLGERNEHLVPLRRFALVLGLGASAAMGVVAFTPLADVWFQTVSGLSPELAAFAIAPTMILVPVPLLGAILSLQRAVLVNGRHTRPITWGTVWEVLAIAALLAGLNTGVHLPGVTIATLAFIGGRLLDLGYLARPTVRVLKRRDRSLGPGDEHAAP